MSIHGRASRHAACLGLAVLAAITAPRSACAQAVMPSASRDDGEGQKRERAALLDLRIGDELDRDRRPPVGLMIGLSSLATAGSVP